MKLQKLFFLSLLSVLLSCSSVEIINKWSSEDIGSMKEKNILVIARTKDNGARITFENILSNELKEKGYKASPSYKVFSMLDPERKISKEEADKIKADFRSKGYNGVILTVVKDVENFTKSVVTNENDFYSGVPYYPRYYRNFYGYYSHPMSYVPYDYYYSPRQEVKTYNSKNYVLETVVYNLDNEDEKQMVGIVTSKIEEPTDVTKASKSYVDKILKGLK